MVNDLMQCVYKLPSIPKIVQELMVTFGSKSGTVADISKKIQSDPVISAKVLRMANSARYGVGRKVAALDSAVVLLGFDVIRTLVVASGVTGAMMNIPGLDMRMFWRESFLIANLSKMLAKSSKEIDPEVAFTCGMVHNIGTALMFLGKCEQMQNLQQSLTQEQSFKEAQQAAFGYDSDEVSAQLAAIWRFPELIQSALRHQSNPMASEPFSPYSGVLFLAHRMLPFFAGGFDLEALKKDMPQDLIEALGIDSGMFYEKLQAMQALEDDIDEMLAA